MPAFLRTPQVIGMLTEKVRFAFDPAHIESTQNNSTTAEDQREVDRLESAVSAGPHMNSTSFCKSSPFTSFNEKEPVIAGNGGFIVTYGTCHRAATPSLAVKVFSSFMRSPPTEVRCIEDVGISKSRIRIIDCDYAPTGATGASDLACDFHRQARSARRYDTVCVQPFAFDRLCFHSA